MRSVEDFCFLRNSECFSQTQESEKTLAMAPVPLKLSQQNSISIIFMQFSGKKLAK